MNLRRVLGNVVSVAGMRATVAVLSFGFFVFAARQWSNRELGEFATVYAIFVLLRQLPLLGLHVLLIRDGARDPTALTQLAPNVLVLAIGTSVVLGTLVGIVGGWVYPPPLDRALWLIGVALVPAAAIVVAESILVAEQRLARTAVLSVADTTARTIAWLGLMIFGGGLTAVCAALAAVQFAMIPIYYVTSGPRTVLRWQHVSVRAISRLLARCPTFLGILLLSAGLSRLDFLSLSALSSLEQVGLYAAPYKVYEVALMVPSVLTLALFPVVSAARRSHGHAFEHLLRQLVRLCVTVGLPCAIALIALAEPLVTALFGPTFAAAGLTLAILGGVPVVVAVDQTLAMALLASGREQVDLTVLTRSCGAYILALLVLVPTMGATGAAIATALVAVLQTAVRYRRVRALGEIPDLVDVVTKPACAAAAMAAAVWTLRPISVVLGLSVGVAVYTAGLSMLRAVTREDVTWVIAALQRPREAS